MGEIEVARFSSPAALAEAAARNWLEKLQQSGSAERIYSVALSGGRIAGLFFSALAASDAVSQLTAFPVHFFWADERCVPPEDPESNFGLADRHLLGPRGVPRERVHRIRGEMEPEAAAEQAQAELRRWTGGGVGEPVLDLVFLGMGEDGHVASLFPSEPEGVRRSPALYRAVSSPKPPPQRVTLGYGVIAAARETWVLISGKGKGGILGEALAGKGDLPLQTVLKLRPRTRILTDIWEG